jgi:hypothetical protein
MESASETSNRVAAAPTSLISSYEKRFQESFCVHTPASSWRRQSWEFVDGSLRALRNLSSPNFSKTQILILCRVCAQRQWNGTEKILPSLCGLLPSTKSSKILNKNSMTACTQHWCCLHKKNCPPSTTSFSGSLEPGAITCQNQIGQVSKRAASFYGHQHFRPATLADLVLNSSTFPIPRLALAGAAYTERDWKRPAQRSI